MRRFRQAPSRGQDRITATPTSSIHRVISSFQARRSIGLMTSICGRLHIRAEATRRSLFRCSVVAAVLPAHNVQHAEHGESGASSYRSRVREESSDGAFRAGRGFIECARVRRASRRGPHLAAPRTSPVLSERSGQVLMDIPLITASLTGDGRVVRCLHSLNTSTNTAASSKASSEMRPLATIGETAETVYAWIIDESRRSK